MNGSSEHQSYELKFEGNSEDWLISASSFDINPTRIVSAFAKISIATPADCAPQVSRLSCSQSEMAFLTAMDG